MSVSKSVEDGIIDHNELLAIMKGKKEYDYKKNESGMKKLSVGGLFNKKKNYNFFSLFYKNGCNNC